jgi:hypothetical protein
VSQHLHTPRNSPPMQQPPMPSLQVPLPTVKKKMKPKMKRQKWWTQREF